MKALLCILFIAILVPVTAQIIPTDRNPKFNTQINPTYNTQINPDWNSRISPRFTINISPKYNSTLNPDFNSSINPQFNSRINPEWNTRINPEYNFSFNPKYNRWTGLYLFDKSNNLNGYLVEAGENVYLYFGAGFAWENYFVKNGDHMNQFTLKGKWTGQYLSTDGAGGYNLFTANDEWTGQHAK